MNYRIPDKKGFVLLEVLPAILLFTTCLIIGTRLYWSQVQIETLLRNKDRVESAFLDVWKVWEEEGGSAALALKAGGESWEIYDLPDDTWLPEGIGIEMVNRHEHPVAFRKSQVIHSGEPSYWEVEMKSGWDTGNTQWKWYRRIYKDALPGIKEEES